MRTTVSLCVFISTPRSFEAYVAESKASGASRLILSTALAAGRDDIDGVYEITALSEYGLHLVDQVIHQHFEDFMLIMFSLTPRSLLELHVSVVACLSNLDFISEVQPPWSIGECHRPTIRANWR